NEHGCPFRTGKTLLLFLFGQPTYLRHIAQPVLRGFPEIQAQNIGRPTLPGQLLTALLIAGGSGGVFRIFTRLGIRSPEERDRKARNERASMKEGTEKPSSDADS
ncbi:uncharacterized protein (DUF2062 family), partial [Salinibacter ruber]